MTNDEKVVQLIKEHRILADVYGGKVYAPHSNTPNKPLGAKTPKGYLRTCINHEGKQVYAMIHRIIFVAAYGVLDKGLQVDHKNGIKTDNRLENLEAVSGNENMRRGVMAGAFKNSGEHNKVDAKRDPKGRFVGKKAAGRKLDGQVWSQLPEPPGA